MFVNFKICGINWGRCKMIYIFMLIKKNRRLTLHKFILVRGYHILILRVDPNIKKWDAGWDF
jgi:hypothetical protein